MFTILLKKNPKLNVKIKNKAMDIINFFMINFASKKNIYIVLKITLILLNILSKIPLFSLILRLKKKEKLYVNLKLGRRGSKYRPNLITNCRAAPGDYFSH